MSISSELLAGWALCAERPSSSDLRILKLEASEGVFASLDSEGRQGLLVELHRGERMANPHVGFGASVKCEPYPFGTTEAPKRGMLLTCCVPDVLEAFAAFGETLVEHRLSGVTAEASFRRAIEDFRKLTASATGDQRSALVGLLGELMTLERLVEVDGSGLDAWMYPDLERHDFRMGTIALEVKTTLRAQAGTSEVRISSIDQLEPPAGGSLFLRFMRLERNPIGNISLADLLTRIAGKLGAARGEELQGRIRGVALPDSLWSDKYSVLDLESYRVEPAFPRLTFDRLVGSKLDEGVRRVSYDLDLAHAASFRCTNEFADAALLGGAGT
jgi:hypothetical protein